MEYGGDKAYYTVESRFLYQTKVLDAERNASGKRFFYLPIRYVIIDSCLNIS